MLSFFYTPEFDDPKSLSAILGPTPGEGDLCGPAESMFFPPPLADEQTSHLIRKMNGLKWLASRASTQEEREDYSTRASWIRNILLNHNMRLIRSIAKRFATAEVTVDDLTSEACEKMLDGIIDSYDFRTEKPFEAFVSLAIKRDIFNVFQKRRLKKEVTHETALTEIVDYRRGEQDGSSVQDQLQELREFIYEHAQDDVAIDILCLRLGLNDGRIRTFEEIAKKYDKVYQWVQHKFDKNMIELFGQTVSGNFIRGLIDRRKDSSDKTRWKANKS